MPAGHSAPWLAREAVLIALLVATAASGQGEATASLSHDCEQSLPGSFPPPDQAPEAHIWKAEADGLPPEAACLPHGPAGSQLWITVAGTTEAGVSSEVLLARFGQVSQMRQIKYWSVSDRQWRPLFASAAALTGPSGTERVDFSPAELEGGAPVYLEQADSRSSHKVVYRMQLLRSDRHGFVISTVNVSPVQWWGMTVYKPGELDTLYFLERAADDQWHFYSLARMSVGSRLFNAQDGSYLNRSVAMYRFIIGRPTDSEPPAVP